MSDIVERLRKPDDGLALDVVDYLLDEAADEIERLRAEVAQLRECAVDLWMMLDDIDTGGDRAKADDVLYRAIAERTHRRRFSPKYQVVIDAIDAARKDTT